MSGHPGQLRGAGPPYTCRTDWRTGEAEVGRNEHSCAICVLQLLFKYDLVKYDMMKDQPAKDQRGFCQRVDKGRRAPPADFLYFLLTNIKWALVLR